jgi:hypothetical protein
MLNQTAELTGWALARYNQIVVERQVSIHTYLPFWSSRLWDPCIQGQIRAHPKELELAISKPGPSL